MAHPKVTAGGGFAYEHKVAAWFAAHMLLEAPPLGNVLGTIQRVDFQTSSHGWLSPVDDVLLTLANQEETHRVAISARSRSETPKSKLPEDHIKASWQLYQLVPNSPYSQGQDKIALAADNLDSQLQKHVRELGQWACAQDDQSFITHASESNAKQKVISKIRENGAKVCNRAISDEELRKLVGDLILLPLEFDDPLAGQEYKAVELCRQALVHEDKDDAKSLWEALQILCRDTDGVAGGITMETLKKELARFFIKCFPRFKKDWESIGKWKRTEIGRISSHLDRRLTISRSDLVDEATKEIESNRVVGLVGRSGTGKSFLAKLWSEKLSPETPVIWLSGDRIIDPTSRQLVIEQQLNHALCELLKTQISGPAYVVLDGIDRLPPTLQSDVRSLISDLELENDACPWRVVITSTDQAWDTFVKECLPDSTIKSTSFVAVPELEDEQLDQALDVLPELSLLKHDPNCRLVLSNLKNLDVVVGGIAVGIPILSSNLANQTNLIEWFWTGRVTGARDGQKRATVLQELGSWQANNMATNMPISESSHPDVAASLINSGICFQLDGAFAFTHDVYGDWSRQRFLLARSAGFAEFADELATQPWWHNSIQLLALHMLEQRSDQSEWQQTFDLLGACTHRHLLQDIFLEPLVLSVNAEGLIESLWDRLIADGGRLLNRFLKMFCFKATRPDPKIEAIFTATEKAKLPVWARVHSRIPVSRHWPATLRCLLKHKAEVLEYAPQEFSKLAEIWLGRGNPNLPMQTDVAHMALEQAENLLTADNGWGKRELTQQSFKAALAGAGAIPQHVGDFALRAAGRKAWRNEDCSELGTSEDELDPILSRRLIPPIPAWRIPNDVCEKPWPDGPVQEPNRHFQELCLGKYSTVLQNLISVDPDVAKEVILSLLIHTPSKTNASFDSPTSELPEFEDVGEWWPAFHMFGPFSSFLWLHPVQGSDLILRFVNFAAQRWCVEQHQTLENAPGVKIPLDSGESWWVGDDKVYYWFNHEHWVPKSIKVALMALERWFYTNIDRGNDVDEVLEKILRESSTVAFAGLLSAVGRYKEILFTKELRPLFAVPEFHLWERRNLGRRQMGDLNHVLIGWNDRDGTLTTQAVEWHDMEHRKVRLEDVAFKLLLTDEETRTYFVKVRTKWQIRLELEQAKDSTDIAEWIDTLIAQFDPSNIRFEADPEKNQTLVTIEMPKHIADRQEAFRAATQDRDDALSLALMCKHILEKTQNLESSELEGFAADIARLDKISSDSLINSFLARGGIRTSGSAVLLRDHFDWLKEQRGLYDRCHADVLVVARALPPLTTNYLAGNQMMMWAEPTLGVGLPVMWAENPRDKKLRKLLGENALVACPETITQLCQTSYERREKLGPDFWQLISLLIDVAVLRFKARKKIEDHRWIRQTPKKQGCFRLGFLKPKRDEIADEGRRILRKFVNGSYETGVPGISKAIPLAQHRRTRNSKDEPEFSSRKYMAVDQKYLEACFFWVPPLDLISDSTERKLVAEFQKQLLQKWLETFPLDTIEAGDDFESGFDGEYKYTSRMAMLLYESSEVGEFGVLWKRVLELGPAFDYWVKSFIDSVVLYGLAEASNAKLFEVWSALMEYAFSLSNWQYGGSKSGHNLAKVWGSFIGVGGYMEMDMLKRDWSKARSDVIERMRPLLEKWVQLNGSKERCIDSYLILLETDAARPIRVASVMWIRTSCKSAGSNFWGRDNRGSSLCHFLDLCWREHERELRQTDGAMKAFNELLSTLAELQLPAAWELQSRVTS